MQSDSSRFINSVSDLYGDDEIELLLQDITELEPTSCKVEDIQAGDGMSSILQDFEIAGSRTGALSAADCTGGCECETPIGTINSWDSHSHYRRRASLIYPCIRASSSTVITPIFGPQPELYAYYLSICCIRILYNITTFSFTIYYIMNSFGGGCNPITTVACLACLCTSGTVKVGLFMLPLVGRLRLMMFVTVLSLLITCVLLFLDISHVVYLFPFNWGKVNAYFYVSLSVLFLVASSLIFHTIFVSDAFSWVPKWTHHQLLVTGCLGYVCCMESLILTIIQKCSRTQYEPVAEDPILNLQERQTSLQCSPDHLIKTANQTTHNYTPIVKYPRYPIAVASTSKHEPTNTYYVDDVQPCSSKSEDHYRVA